MNIRFDFTDQGKADFNKCKKFVEFIVNNGRINAVDMKNKLNFSVSDILSVPISVTFARVYINEKPFVLYEEIGHSLKTGGKRVVNFHLTTATNNIESLFTPVNIYNTIDI